MQRLFSGTPWDRPPTCARCGQPEAGCSCPPAPAGQASVRLPPEAQTARLRLEQRARGKVVTLVAGLDPTGNDLTALASQLKAGCGTGGTAKEGLIELQGDHLSAVETALHALGYKTHRK